jgi:hypothetical protein
MPAKSAKQLRFMQAIAHGAKSKTGVGPSQEVAREFVKKTPKGLFGKKDKKRG